MSCCLPGRPCPKCVAKLNMLKHYNRRLFKLATRGVILPEVALCKALDDYHERRRRRAR